MKMIVDVKFYDISLLIMVFVEMIYIIYIKYRDLIISIWCLFSFAFT